MIRVLFVFLLAPFGAPAVSQPEYVTLPEILELVPQNENLENIAFGDLNGDEWRDIVTVSRSKDPDYFRLYGFDALGYERFVNENLRRLRVYFGLNDGSYGLIATNETLIPADYLYGDQPFEGLRIDSDKKTLHLYTRFWTSMGSWLTSRTEFIFRFQNEQMQLIGSEGWEMNRASGEGYEISINFSTGTVVHIRGDMMDETGLKKARYSVDVDSIERNLAVLHNDDYWIWLSNLEPDDIEFRPVSREAID